MLKIEGIGKLKTMKKIIYLILIGSILYCSSSDKKDQKDNENRGGETNKQEPVKEPVKQESAKQTTPSSGENSNKYDLSDSDGIRHRINMIDPKSDLIIMETQLKYIKQRRILAEKRAKEAEKSYQKSLEEERKSISKTQ